MTFSFKSKISKVKNNFIELKTLEYLLQGDKEAAKRVFNIRHKLNSLGFELYIKYYLKHMGFKMNYLTGGIKADGGIDLKGSVNNEKVFIQCKKYIENGVYKGKVGVNELRDFFGGVISVDGCETKINNRLLMFITTGFFSNYAKKFANKNHIDLFNFIDISDISNNYSIDTFEKEFIKSGGKLINIENNTFEQIHLIDYTFDELTESEKLKFWKNVRSHIVDENSLDEQNTGYETFSDELLIKFSEIRTYGGLKLLYTKCNDHEQKNIDKYINEIKRGIEVLQKEKNKS